jgi:hypothetical protein
MRSGSRASGNLIRSNSVRHTKAIVGVNTFSLDDMTKVVKVINATFLRDF